MSISENTETVACFSPWCVGEKKTARKITIYTTFIERGTEIDRSIACFTLDLEDQCKIGKEK